MQKSISDRGHVLLRIVGAFLILIVFSAITYCAHELKGNLEAYSRFDTPTHECVSLASVDTGERINGAPVYEMRCSRYFRRD